MLIKQSKLRQNLIFIKGIDNDRMTSFFFAFLLCFGVSSYSQQSTAEVEFIRWYFKDKNIHYANEIPFIFSRLTEPVKNDTILGGASGRELLVLNAQEQSGLEKAMLEMAGGKWVDGLLPGSEIINQTTINSILGDKGHGWSSFQASYGTEYYSISRPMFLKGGTFCIFYYDYTCGAVCAEGELAVFKKVTSVWQKWRVLSKWKS